MPTSLRPAPPPVVPFAPLLEISPFTLFRRLGQADPPTLLDARARPYGTTLRGGVAYEGEEWSPAEDHKVVLFDRDGSEAEPIVRRLQAAGHGQVKMLFGGLELYEFSLDPGVVGEETYLEIP